MPFEWPEGVFGLRVGTQKVIGYALADHLNIDQLKHLVPYLAGKKMFAFGHLIGQSPAELFPAEILKPEAAEILSNILKYLDITVGAPTRPGIITSFNRPTEGLIR